MLMMADGVRVLNGMVGAVRMHVAAGRCRDEYLLPDGRQGQVHRSECLQRQHHEQQKEDKTAQHAGYNSVPPPCFPSEILRMGVASRLWWSAARPNFASSPCHTGKPQWLGFPAPTRRSS